MRLSGGEARGRRLKGPRAAGLRPTSGRVREALFDILGSRVPGSSFLDVYAGTGAVGIEALSRGARRAVLLEGDRRALRLIRENLRLGPWQEASEVLAGDVRRSLRRLLQRPERFQVVFLDPPYDVPFLPEVLEAAAALVEPGGLVVVEHRAGRPVAFPGAPALWSTRGYRYGDTGLTVLRPRAEARDPR